MQSVGIELEVQLQLSVWLRVSRSFCHRWAALSDLLLDLETVTQIKAEYSVSSQQGTNCNNFYTAFNGNECW